MKQMKRIFTLLFVAMVAMTMWAQSPLKRVYNESVEPLQQIEAAVERARQGSKHVVCQVGGNWCIWCLRFADFIEKDTTIAQLVADNYEYIHVNYNPRQKVSPELMKRLDNCGRFGYPVLVVLDGEGRVIHIQDSGLLEEGKGYSKDKVERFFRLWTPQALEPPTTR